MCLSIRVLQVSVLALQRSAQQQIAHVMMHTSNLSKSIPIHMVIIALIAN
jgi:hypothetical protein